MINNYKCEECLHSLVCEHRKLIDKFGETEKKNLGIDITIDECINFDKNE